MAPRKKLEMVQHGQTVRYPELHVPLHAGSVVNSGWVFQGRPQVECITVIQPVEVTRAWGKCPSSRMGQSETERNIAASCSSSLLQEQQVQQYPQTVHQLCLWECNYRWWFLNIKGEPKTHSHSVMLWLSQSQFFSTQILMASRNWDNSGAMLLTKPGVAGDVQLDISSIPVIPYSMVSDNLS